MANEADPDKGKPVEFPADELPMSMYKREECSVCKATRDRKPKAPCAVCASKEFTLLRA